VAGSQRPRPTEKPRDFQAKYAVCSRIAKVSARAREKLPQKKERQRCKSMCSPTNEPDQPPCSFTNGRHTNRLSVSAGFFRNFLSVRVHKRTGVTQVLYGARLFRAIVVRSDDWNKPRIGWSVASSYMSAGIAQPRDLQRAQPCAKRRCRSKHRSYRCVSGTGEVSFWPARHRFNSNQISRGPSRDQIASFGLCLHRGLAPIFE